jgi:uncharacterized protein (TIGR03437 family)
MTAQSIDSVTNAAGDIPAGLPNSGIARGSMFVVKGSGLGPATFVVASAFPLQTSIGGTSVRVTVSGTTVSAIMYYAGATQVAAILPSSTPTGTGTVTVTYNNQTSPAAPITVVQTAVGIFTVSQNGQGDAIAFLGTTLVAPGNAVNPGEIVSFWGTGLGPVTFDETNAAQQTDMTNIPLEAYVGGRLADIVFRGRNNCCSSIDAIYVRMPAGVEGCATPVVFRGGNVVSNTTTVAMAASGRACTPTTPGVTTGDISGALSGGVFAAGGINLIRSVTTTLPITAGPVTIPGQTTRSDSGAALFFRYRVLAGAAGLGSRLDIASFGSCIVTVVSVRGAGPAPDPSITYLDAGASISVNGPNGPRALNRTTAGNILAYSNMFDQNGTYLSAGAYTFTGPGGADVGSFTASLTVPQPLVWTNQATTTSVNRASGVTLTWTGGDPSGYVQITGSSSVLLSGNNTVAASFTCTARAGDGSFTVPPVVLLALPASGSQTQGGITIPIPGSLGVSNFTVGGNFRATGLDFGNVSSIVSNNSQVTYN